MAMRVKECKQKRRYDALYKEITSEMDIQNITAEEMAREIGVCTATFYNRLANPGKFQLEEVLKLCRRLGFPIEKTRSLLRYV